MSFTGTEDLQEAYLKSLQLDRIGESFKTVSDQLSHLIKANQPNLIDNSKKDQNGKSK